MGSILISIALSFYLFSSFQQADKPANLNVLLALMGSIPVSLAFHFIFPWVLAERQTYKFNYFACFDGQRPLKYSVSFIFPWVLAGRQTYKFDILLASMGSLWRLFTFLQPMKALFFFCCQPMKDFYFFSHQPMKTFYFSVVGL